MKLILLLFLNTIFLLANTNYPELFSQLGTPLYEADKKFSALPKNQQYSFDVSKYHINQEQALSLYESGNKPGYFKALRSLSKDYHKIIAIIKREMTNAIKKNDYIYFISLSNAGIDSLYQQESFKSQSYAFYLQNRDKGESTYLEKRIQSEKGYQKLYGIDISSNSYSSTPTQSHHKRQKKVVLLSSPGCGYCIKAKAFMRSQNINFTEYNVRASAEGKSLFRKYKGTGVPLIIIGDEVIRGYSKSSILSAL